ncbi:hypothetical protein ABZ297_04955 [Nonomuraea sp. NPDC005983]|uniref:hypothetical protein n=1 Tax=Nonomuraea sp. NPDC005983 TaxID=3155595 RepID=UPI0033A84066
MHTGGHVHVGVPDYGTSVADHVRLLKLYHGYEDVPEAGRQGPARRPVRGHPLAAP